MSELSTPSDTKSVENFSTVDMPTPVIFSANGRIGRVRYLAYLWATCVMLFASWQAMRALAIFLNRDYIDLFPIVGVVAFVAFTARRLTDVNASPWLLWLQFVPFVNFALYLWLIAWPGSAEANGYGPAPAPNSKSVVILLWSLIILTVPGAVLWSHYVRPFTS